MIPGAFAYHRPKSVSEAVGLLAQLGDDGRALAGGRSLIPMMKLRLATPAHLVDLAGIADLKGVHADGADIVIGAAFSCSFPISISSRPNSSTRCSPCMAPP